MSGAEQKRIREQRRKGPLRLLVEGPDDMHAIIGLVSRHDIPWDSDSFALPFVEDAGGVENLLKGLPTAVSAAYDRLGVVVDMDDPEGRDRWAQVRDRLRDKHVEVPDAPAPDGTIVPGLRGPSSLIGIWLMPDNRSAGALEHFLHTLIPAGDPCFSHAEDSTKQARKLGAPLAEKDHMKGALHAWLAWRASPGVPFGTALTSKYLSHDSEEALCFVAWFKKLFLEPVAVTDRIASPL